MSNNSYRSYDGYQNNLQHTHWGQARQPLLKITDIQPETKPINPFDRPNARRISNLVCRDDIPQLSSRGLSDFVWVWGQFLLHELCFIPDDKSRPIISTIPTNDGYFPGGELLLYQSRTAPDDEHPGLTAPLNRHSSYLDGTAIYGFNKTRADCLRAFDGSGRLRTSNNKLPPLLTVPGTLFLAGDKRVNLHVVLAAIHTVLIREHNRRCQIISNHLAEQMKLDDEAIYQRARRYVGALLQLITYEEFLPALLAPDSLAPYAGYNPQIKATVSDIFASAALPLVHSMLPDRLRVENRLGELLLIDTFTRPDLLLKYGIEAFLIGLTRQRARQISVSMVESIRSATTLNQPQQPCKLKDLAAKNILRGRDHDLPDYNRCREIFYLAPLSSVDDITTNEILRNKLKEAYEDNLNLVDPWIGGLAETDLNEDSIGPLFLAVLKDQFERSRDGDRFWYEHDPQFVQELAETKETLASFKRRRLSDVIRDNTAITFLHGNVFYAAP